MKPQLEKLGFTVEDSRPDVSQVSAAVPRNQILYGPPGTGKTWHTVDVALSIVDGGSGEHDVERFEELRFDVGTGAGNIALVTFHQNFAYEDFVEGIRPVLGTGNFAMSFTKVCSSAWRGWHWRSARPSALCSSSTRSTAATSPGSSEN